MDTIFRQGLVQPNKYKLSLQGDLKIQFLSKSNNGNITPHLHHTIEVPVPHPRTQNELQEVLPKTFEGEFSGTLLWKTMEFTSEGLSL